MTDVGRFRAKLCCLWAWPRQGQRRAKVRIGPGSKHCSGLSGTHLFSFIFIIYMWIRNYIDAERGGHPAGSAFSVAICRRIMYNGETNLSRMPSMFLTRALARTRFPSCPTRINLSWCIAEAVGAVKRHLQSWSGWVTRISWSSAGSLIGRARSKLNVAVQIFSR